MKVLLDTHVFLWLLEGNLTLSHPTITLLENPRNILFFSHGSVWEMAIKISQKKLKLPGPLQPFLTKKFHQYGISPLAISIEHLGALSSLPNIHKDPFDRLLIAQSRVENIPLLTADPWIARYPIETIKA